MRITAVRARMRRAKGRTYTIDDLQWIRPALRAFDWMYCPFKDKLEVLVPFGQTDAFCEMCIRFGVEIY